MRLFPAVLWAVFIFWLSSQPKLPASAFAFPGMDKVLHALAYAVLCAALLWGLRDRARSGAALTPALVALGVGLASAYGIVDEIHQSFVPGRDASPWDFAADFVGAMAYGSWCLLFGIVRSQADTKTASSSGQRDGIHL